MSFLLNFTAGCIREWSRSDAEALVRHGSNPNVSRYLSTRFPYPYTPDDAEAWFSLLEAEPRSTQWALDVGGEAVGGIGIRLGAGELSRTGDLGYWLAEPYWGRGIVTAAVVAMVPYAMSRFGLMRLQAYAATENQGSIRVLEKAGFVREGVLRARAVKGDRVEDHVLYALIAPTLSD